MQKLWSWETVIESLEEKAEDCSVLGMEIAWGDFRMLGKRTGFLICVWQVRRGSLGRTVGETRGSMILEGVFFEPK